MIRMYSPVNRRITNGVTNGSNNCQAGFASKQLSLILNDRVEANNVVSYMAVGNHLNDKC